MYDVPIERGKLLEFARATLAKAPEHLSGEPVATPTFLTIAGNFWAPKDGSVPSVGFDVRRLLHGEEEFIFHGPPPRAGATLKAETRLGERYEKPGKRGGQMRFAQLITDYHDEAGALVAQQITTLVETAQPAKEA